MKLVQLNVWWGGKLRSNLLKFFENQQADILCLQEAVSYDRPDSGMFLTTEELARRFSYKYVFWGPMFTFRMMKGSATFGNAILSRFPIKESECVYVNLGHTRNFDFNDHDYNVRNFIHSIIKVGGQPLNVITHHGHHIPDHKNGDKNTIRQMEMLARYLDKLHGAIILTGDFNLGPRSKSLGLINQRLKNLVMLHNLRTTRTALTARNEVCDYIFVNNQVKVKDFEALDDLVSDHKALLLDFDL